MITVSKPGSRHCQVLQPADATVPGPFHIDGIPCLLPTRELRGMLAGLGVRFLVLPAVESVCDMWCTNFGFVPLRPLDAEVLEERVIMPDGATLLCKPCDERAKGADESEEEGFDPERDASCAEESESEGEGALEAEAPDDTAVAAVGAVRRALQQGLHLLHLRDQ
ncbi:hypothetical protein F751_5158 [Auxenochlorella protothecoides]|uniref:Uncharacterized protein n=1 Tax=Auxenochlorella protothecoides TaxID=3075 RepID=A0A087SQP3_AUXPR|nr:hypothetical protein F751_5158 [Auxenochlorella protothecoides]KFM28047.1 hypothetical protein F751_5158 [Auxenochlorella protothecoides]